MTKPNQCIWPIRTHYTFVSTNDYICMYVVKTTSTGYSGLQLLPSYIHDPWKSLNVSDQISLLLVWKMSLKVESSCRESPSSLIWDIWRKSGLVTLLFTSWTRDFKFVFHEIDFLKQFWSLKPCSQDLKIQNTTFAGRSSLWC